MAAARVSISPPHHSHTVGRFSLLSLDMHRVECRRHHPRFAFLKSSFESAAGGCSPLAGIIKGLCSCIDSPWPWQAIGMRSIERRGSSAALDAHRNSRS